MMASHKSIDTFANALILSLYGAGGFIAICCCVYYYKIRNDDNSSMTETPKALPNCVFVKANRSSLEAIDRQV